MGKRTADGQTITNLTRRAKQGHPKSEEERKTELKKSVKIGSIPHDYAPASAPRERRAHSPSFFTMRWVDSRKPNGNIVTSSGRMFLS